MFSALIILLQTSPESPDIFRLIHRINLAEDSSKLRLRTREAGVSDEDFEAYLLYCSGFGIGLTYVSVNSGKHVWFTAIYFNK